MRREGRTTKCTPTPHTDGGRTQIRLFTQRGGKPMLKHISFFSNFGKYDTVEPRYADTLWTRKKRRHKRSIVVTGVEETYAYK